MTDSANNYNHLSEEIAEIASQMKPEWLTFANSWIQSGNKLESYREAYRGAESYNGTKASACKLSNKPLVVKYVKAVKSQIAKNNLMSIEEVQQEVLKRAFADMTDFLGWNVQVDEEGNETFVPVIKKSSDELTPEQRRLIKGVTLTKQGPKFEVADQRGYMDMYIKMVGGYAPEKKEITGNGGGALEMVITDLSTDELEDELKNLGIDDESNRGE